MLDAVEGEPNHVCLACVVPIAQIQLLAGDGFLSILMTGYLRLGKKVMDTINGCLMNILGCESCSTAASWQNRNHQHKHGGA